MANKKWLVTGTLVIAAVIAFVALRGPRLAGNGTEGAIGAANRYQSQQMTGNDVSLDNPEAAAFIQSDAFRKIAADPSLREAFRSADLNRVLAAEGFRGRTDAVAAFVGSDNARTLLGNDKIRAALDQGVFQGTDIGQLAARRVDAARWVEAHAALAKDEATRKFFAEAAAIRSAEALRNRANEQAVLKESALWKDAFSSKAIEAGAHALLGLDEARRTAALDAMRAADFAAAAKIEGMRDVVEGLAASRGTVDALRAVAGDQALVTALQNRNVIEAARNPEFARLAEANRVSEALKSTDAMSAKATD
jgi:hypothetical protein